MLAVYYILRGLDDGDTMGDIKEAHLQLLVECEDPDELMRIGKRAFCLDSVAVEGINQRDIKAWYSELYTTVSLYEKAKDEIEECEFKSKLENIVNNVLDVYEFQTACFVVADFEGKVDSSDKEIRPKFLNYLYNNKARYMFFEDREKVVDKLIELEAIKESEYKLS